MYRLYLFAAAAAAFAMGIVAAQASPRAADMRGGAKSLATGQSDLSSARKKSRKVRRGGTRGGRDAKGTGGGRGGESGSR